VGGVLWALFFSFTIPFLLTFIPLKKLLRTTYKNTDIRWKDIGVYAVPTTVAVFSLSAFTSNDLLLVKHFFSSHDAGLYAGLALVGRVIFYFTAPISSVMFPLIIKRFTNKEKFQNLFYMALLLVLVPSVGLTLFYFVLPHLVIKILLGGRGYDVVAGYIGWYGFYLTIFSVLNVLVNFFLSLKRTEVAWLIALGAVSQVVLISFFHQDFIIIISISILVTLVLLVLLLLYYTKEYANTNFIKKTISLTHHSRV
jgi:O-antigen/teichoic acid export membrane protein